MSTATSPRIAADSRSTPLAGRVGRGLEQRLLAELDAHILADIGLEHLALKAQQRRRRTAADLAWLVLRSPRTS